MPHAMAPYHDGSAQRAGMAIGRRAQQWFVHVYSYVYTVLMGGAGGFWDGLPMVSRVGWEGLGGWGWVANG